MHIENIRKANSTRAFIQRNLQHCPQRTKSACYRTHAQFGTHLPMLTSRN